MMFRLPLLCAAIVLFVSGPAFAQGTMRTVQIDSKFLKKTLTVKIWTPPGYGAETNRRYPVIYCCQNTGMPTKQIADLIAAGHYPPFIMVNFEGLPFGGEESNAAVWSDMRQPSGSFFRLELIPWIDANYRTIANERGRVLIGCSKAGGGVTHLGLKYPELFCAFVSLDGALTLYDKGGRDLDYVAKGDGYFQLIEKNDQKLKTMPMLFIEGGWFWKAGRGYLDEFRKRGLEGVEVIDDRDLDHAVGVMFVRHLPEIMTVFVNGTSGAPLVKPRIEPAGGVFALSTQVRLLSPAAGISLFATTDGSDPALKGMLVTGPITLDKSALVRVVGKSNDGSIATRQAIARFDLPSPRPPAPAKSLEPGWNATYLRGPVDKDLSKRILQVHLGKAEPLATVKIVTLDLPTAPEDVKTEKDGIVVFHGLLDVPETSSYRFLLEGNSPGLYVSGPAMSSIEKVVQMRAVKTLEVSLVLDRGPHFVAIVSSVSAGKGTIDVKVRDRDGAYVSIPRSWLKHVGE